MVELYKRGICRHICIGRHLRYLCGKTNPGTHHENAGKKTLAKVISRYAAVPIPERVLRRRRKEQKRRNLRCYLHKPQRKQLL